MTEKRKGKSGNDIGGKIKKAVQSSADLRASPGFLSQFFLVAT